MNFSSPLLVWTLHQPNVPNVFLRTILCMPSEIFHPCCSEENGSSYVSLPNFRSNQVKKDILIRLISIREVNTAPHYRIQLGYIFSVS